MNYVTLESLYSLLIDIRIELAKKADGTEMLKLRSQMTEKMSSLNYSQEWLKRPSGMSPRSASTPAA